MSAEGVSLLGAVEGETCEQDNEDRIGHAASQSGGRLFVLDGAHSQRVVANNPLSPAKDVRRSGAAGCSDAGGLV